MRRLPRDYMDNTSKSCNWVRASYRLQDALKPGVNDSGQHPLTSHVCYRSRSQVARGAALGHLPTPRPPSSGNGWPALCSQHLPQWVPCPVLRLQCAYHMRVCRHSGSARGSRSCNLLAGAHAVRNTAVLQLQVWWVQEACHLGHLSLSRHKPCDSSCTLSRNLLLADQKSMPPRTGTSSSSGPKRTSN